MKLLTKNTDYAVRAVLYCAAKGPGSFSSSSEIAEKQSIPLTFLRVILGKLIHAGILSSREGKAGGVAISRPADRITLIDLMGIFQGEVKLSECMFRRKICPNRATCVVRKRINGIEDIVSREFGAITIADLLNDIGGAGNEKKNNKHK